MKKRILIVSAAVVSAVLLAKSALAGNPAQSLLYRGTNWVPSVQNGLNRVLTFPVPPIVRGPLAAPSAGFSAAQFGWGVGQMINPYVSRPLGGAIYNCCMR